MSYTDILYTAHILQPTTRGDCDVLAFGEDVVHLYVQSMTVILSWLSAVFIWIFRYKPALCK